jgi:hypothetical protein
MIMQGMPLLEWLLNISNVFVTAGANLMVQSAIIIAAGLCIGYALRYRGAVVQSFIYRMFLIAVFLCSLASFMIDSMATFSLKLTVPPAVFSYSGNTPFNAQTDEISGIARTARLSPSPGSTGRHEQLFTCLSATCYKSAVYTDYITAFFIHEGSIFEV